MTVFYWQHISAFWAVAATGVMLIGIWLIYRSWRWQKRGGLLPGWALLALSLATWSLAGGTWIGLPIGACALMLLVLAWIALQGQWTTLDRVPSIRSPANAPVGDSTLSPSSTQIPSLPLRVWLRGGARVLVAGPLAAVFALTTGVLLAQLLMAVDADRVFTERLAVTVIWTAGMAWASIATRLLRPTMIMAGSSAAALGLLMLVR